jgi:DNA-binding protein HU-beta
MQKIDIINQIARTTGQKKNDVEDIVEATMSVIKKNMSEGRNIYLRGFGSFIVKKRAKKTARNISAGTTVIIPEHYIPAFKPAQEFLDMVKNNVK